MKILFFRIILVSLILSLYACRINNYPPEIWRVTPGIARIGEDITLTGAKFGDKPTVTFGISGTTASGTVKSQNGQNAVVTVPRMRIGNSSVQITNEDGVSEPLPFTVLQPVPVLTSVSPKNGLSGATITINGDFLDQLRSVRIGNVPVTAISDTTQQSIKFIIPANLPRGPVSLTVTTSGGEVTTDFLIAGMPEITSFSPRRSRAGAEITIQGRNFTGALVTIGGAPVDINVTGIQDNEIRTYIPASATTGRILVTTYGRLTATSTDTLFIILPPAVTGFSQTEGARGDKFLITGQHLSDVTRVGFGGFSASYKVLSDTQLEVTVPATATAGEYAISLINVAGSATSPVTYFVVLPPTILALSAARVKRGDQLTITGQNMHRIQQVQIGNVTAPIVARTEGSSVRVTVPADAVSGNVQVTNRAGSSQLTTPLTVVQRPSVTSFTSQTAVGGRVVIKGSFLRDADVFFAGSTAAATFDGRNTEDEIWVRVPTDAQNGVIRVVNITGEVSTSSAFTVLRVPANLAFTPESARVGSEITINGQNLGTVTSVRFGNGTSSIATFRVSGTSLIVTVPADAKDGPVCLTNPAGTVCTDKTLKIL